MSKVDLTVFEKYLEQVNCGLGEFIYQLANGDRDWTYSELSYPEREGRKYDDPTYQAEHNAWREQNDKLDAAFLESSGYEHLDGYSSGEGGDEYCYGVFKLKDKVYKAEYRYYSHHGHDYDDIESTLREVKPVQKTIVVWE